MDGGDQADFVTSNIEDGEFANLVGGGKEFS
jgi:hypothetical protein